MSARFEIVTAARDRHWARFIAANGRTVWTTETYKRRAGAENAICSLAGAFITRSPFADHPEIKWPANRETGIAEVRYVTAIERTDRPELGSAS